MTEFEDQHVEYPTQNPTIVTRTYIYFYGQHRVKIETKNPAQGCKWPEILAEC